MPMCSFKQNYLDLTDSHDSEIDKFTVHIIVTKQAYYADSSCVGLVAR